RRQHSADDIVGFSFHAWCPAREQETADPLRESGLGRGIAPPDGEPGPLERDDKYEHRTRRVPEPIQDFSPLIDQLWVFDAEYHTQEDIARNRESGVERSYRAARLPLFEVGPADLADRAQVSADMAGIHRRCEQPSLTAVGLAFQDPERCRAGYAGKHLFEV